MGKNKAFTWLSYLMDKNVTLIINANRSDSAEMAANDRALMDVIYAQGWSESPDFMTKEEAEQQVEGIGTVFSNNENIVDLTCLKYFGQSALGGMKFNNMANLVRAAIPQNIKTLDVNALFYNCPNLESCDLGNVENVTLSPFNTCPNLRYVDISKIKIMNNSLGADIIITEFPKDVVSYPEGAFRNNPNVTAEIIPEGVTSIGKNSFLDCTNFALKSLPSTLTYIGQTAFCRTKTDKVKLYAIVPPTIQASPLGGNDYYVPDESVSAYKSASVWSGMNIKPMSEYTE